MAEEETLAYLMVAAEQAPTKGQIILEAVAFTGYLFNVEVDQVLSPRARGIAYASPSTKPPTRKRPH